MTHHLDVAVRREVVARWCALAEQRLLHLTELFETGRWRRYYSERAFLENVREAKKAVETWRTLSSALAAHRSAPSGAFPTERSAELIPLASAAPIAAPLVAASLAASRAATVEEAASSAPRVDLEALERALLASRPRPMDIAAVQQRYPLLRNTL
jgi:hypothetical protein